MDPMTIAALIGAGVGLVKGMGDKDQEERDRALAAETARWSPWTGMQGKIPNRVDPLGSAFQGMLAGGSFGQGLDKKANAPNMSVWSGVEDPGRTVNGYTQQGPPRQF